MSEPQEPQYDMENLLQRDLITDFIPRIGKTPWQVVYDACKDQSNEPCIFSALLKQQAVKKALTRESWDLNIGDGLPGFSLSWREGKEIARYHRFGFEEIRPLVIHRHFHGAWPDYLELCEEFRHFHNLAEDHQRQILLDFDKSGEEIEVAQITEHRVTIYWKYLRQFLAATQLYLAVYFDSVRFSMIPLQEVPEEDRRLEQQGEGVRYSLYVSSGRFQKGHRTFSRLFGKVIIAPPPIEECGRWPFDEDTEDTAESEVLFTIGEDQKGKRITFTSNPDKLSNYFSVNSEAPHYLTPVFFRKEVLQKYYDYPERYSVEDGYLRCLGLWGMQIDNSHPTHIVAFLGDLGRDLPYRERLHWKQYNVSPPPDAKISETNFRRSFLSQFTEPAIIDLIFRQEYQRLNQIWHEKMGWSLFRDPKPGDEYILRTIRVPVTASQRELDEQILGLTKLLVDSLNEERLARELPSNVQGERGIHKLNRFLESREAKHREQIVQFLKDLQRLRSTGVAHRKGKEYEKTLKRLGLMGKKGPEVMKILLKQAVTVLRFLRIAVTEQDTS